MFQASFDQYDHAYHVMNTWRASHSFPLNTLQMSLRKRSREIDPQAFVAQRLKRAPAVVSKLERNPSMKLSRMQDLGGCRSILRDIDQVYELRRRYKESRDRHSLASEKDYISQPRDSGYRGVHVIYQYRSDRKSEYNGHRIELQLRTQVQHAWATAVEIAGIYVRSPLKSSIGPDDWLQFFQLASSAFCNIEGTAPLDQHKGLDVGNEIKILNEKIDALAKLENFSVVHDVVQQQRKKSHRYFVLFLDLQERRLTLEPFSGEVESSLRYAELERETIDDTNKDVVLVSTDSIDAVAAAYPNYFADTSKFIGLMRDYLI